MSSEVQTAYSARATEYADRFGSIQAAHPSDRQLVSTWATDIHGSVIDAGCGPGQWTEFLAERGLTVEGVDQVPEFIRHANQRSTAARFRVGGITALDVPPGSVGGVLTWYSLIHFPPEEIQEPLAEFARVLKPDGTLLVGFFEGPAIVGFDHAVITAYQWPVTSVSDELVKAGFEVIETHTRTSPNHRPHAAIIARRAEAR
jgi:ubiquinone/menaquinone biosynthesis C-methylase UbiE